MSAMLRLRNPGWSCLSNLLMSLPGAQANSKPYNTSVTIPAKSFPLLDQHSESPCPGRCGCFLLHSLSLVIRPGCGGLHCLPRRGSVSSALGTCALCVWWSSAFAYLKTPLFAFILKEIFHEYRTLGCRLSLLSWLLRCHCYKIVHQGVVTWAQKEANSKAGFFKQKLWITCLSHIDLQKFCFAGY